jgi:hypothetical protein
MQCYELTLLLVEPLAYGIAISHHGNDGLLMPG